MLTMGVANVASDYGRIFDGTVSAAGAGVLYTLIREESLNIRLDVSRASDGEIDIYVGIREVL